MPWINRDDLEDLQDRMDHLEEVQDLLARRFPDLLKKYEVRNWLRSGTTLSTVLLRKEVTDLEAFEASTRGRKIAEHVAEQLTEPTNQEGELTMAVHVTTSQGVFTHEDATTYMTYEGTLEVREDGSNKTYTDWESVRIEEKGAN